MGNKRTLFGDILVFYACLVKNRIALCFACGFLATKIWSNVALGGRLITGIRSGLMGLGAVSLGLGLIHLLSEKTRKQSPPPSLRLPPPLFAHPGKHRHE